MSKHLALAGPLAAVLLAGGCGDIMISISTDGRIEVFVSTMGADLDLDGFSVSVDGGAERIVPRGGAVTLTDLREGSHSVRLSGLGDNCRVEGSNPRAVVVGAGGTAAVAFEVRCTRDTARGFSGGRDGRRTRRSGRDALAVAGAGIRTLRLTVSCGRRSPGTTSHPERSEGGIPKGIAPSLRSG